MGTVDVPEMVENGIRVSTLVPEELILVFEQQEIYLVDDNLNMKVAGRIKVCLLIAQGNG